MTHRKTITAPPRSAKSLKQEICRALSNALDTHWQVSKSFADGHSTGAYEKAARQKAAFSFKGE